MQELDERYSVGARIGRGGAGEVYEGLQHALQRPVAIKVLRPELTSNPGAIVRFEREALTTCRLHHPNVVTVFDVGATPEGQRFLVMELLEGETLSKRMAAEGPMDDVSTIEIARQIVRGMAAGQGVGLVHRDLKPDNIFITHDGQVKIDFGLAVLRESMPLVRPPLPTQAPVHDTPRAVRPPADDSLAPVPHHTLDELRSPVAAPAPGPSPTWSGSHAEGHDAPSSGASDGRLTRPGSLMGTPRYMSPEQVLGWEADHRSDLYAFGCVLYEMLVGTAPFGGPTSADYLEQHLHALPPPIADAVGRELDPGLGAIVDRLLRKRPEDRFQDWAALAEHIRRLARPAAARDATPSVPAPPSRPDCPYRFLRPFTGATQSIFFGRDADALAFRDAWQHPDQVPMLVLTGASGVGKTSFLSARVVPGLEDTEHEVVQISGTANPTGQLARVLARRLARDSDERVAVSDASLPELLDTLADRTGRPVAIVLDQLEEVFTSGGEAEAQQLQSDLAAALAGRTGSARFVLSLREDFLGPLLRALHPLPTPELTRILPLRPLGPDDLAAALEGPGSPVLPVDYAPFSYAPGLVDRIVADLVTDGAGEVAPRVQAVGQKLWEMVKEDRDPVIEPRHYVDRLGGARGILARLLDEAVDDLPPGDEGVAKEMLRALTHLPGSATSRPTPGSALVAHAEDRARREAILRVLEDRWRVLHGYVDDRWPDERTYRIAHEALIGRIQDYAAEDSGRNRARQLFHQGLGLWLQGGRQDAHLLPEEHFDDVQRHAHDLVLGTDDERAFYEACTARHNEGWYRRLLEERRANVRRNVALAVGPALLVVLGFVLGQLPVAFVSVHTARVRVVAALGVPAPDLSGVHLRGARLSGIELPGADLSGTDLRDADLQAANLETADLRQADLRDADLRGANLRGADLDQARLLGAALAGTDLRHASVRAAVEGADLSGAIFDTSTLWGPAGPAAGALGPEGQADGAQLAGVVLDGVDLYRVSLVGADLSGASLVETAMEEARLGLVDLSGAMAWRARMAGAHLGAAKLNGAVLALADLSGADLAQADLRESNLVGARLATAAGLDRATLTDAAADLRTTWPPGFDPAGAGVLVFGGDAGATWAGRDLRSAWAEGADLHGADLRGAVLRDAVLTGADLRDAALVGADLRGAQLGGAQLCGADLTDAALAQASFAGASACDGTRWPRRRPPPGLVH